VGAGGRVGRPRKSNHVCGFVVRGSRLSGPRARRPTPNTVPTHVNTKNRSSVDHTDAFRASHQGHCDRHGGVGGPEATGHNNTTTAPPCVSHPSPTHGSRQQRTPAYPYPVPPLVRGRCGRCTCTATDRRAGTGCQQQAQQGAGRRAHSTYLSQPPSQSHVHPHRNRALQVCSAIVRVGSGCVCVGGGGQGREQAPTTCNGKA
jgi:hypothetical protein